MMNTDLLFYPFFPREIGIHSNSYFQRRTCTTSEFFEKIDKARWRRSKYMLEFMHLIMGKL